MSATALIAVLGLTSLIVIVCISMAIAFYKVADETQ